MTWADIVVADFLGCGSLPELYKDLGVASVSPMVAKHVEKVCNLPNIKKWIENRPEDK